MGDGGEAVSDARRSGEARERARVPLVSHARASLVWTCSDEERDSPTEPGRREAGRSRAPDVAWEEKRLLAAAAASDARSLARVRLDAPAARSLPQGVASIA